MNLAANSQWQLPGGYSLELPEVELSEASLQSLYFFQALDRPDRCQVRLSVTRCTTSLPFSERAQIRLRAQGRLCFAGTVADSRLGFDAREGGWVELTAYADFHYRRLLTGGWLYQLTDAELARRLAGDIGLVPVVDKTKTIHARVRVAGDALALLRERAKRCGYKMGVTAGKLLFCRSWPLRAPPKEMEHGCDVLGLECRSRGNRKFGTFTVVGGGAWQPLSTFRIHDLAESLPRGGYVTRALHLLDTNGYRTRVQFREPEPQDAMVAQIEETA